MRLAQYAAGALCALAVLGAHGADPRPTANGIELPKGYKDWRVIAVSDRSDNKTMRAIIGNDIAVAAARAGKTSPWPEGAVIGKIVWKRAQDPLWQAATVPGEIVHVEFMLKDAAGAAQECFACHGAAKGQDFVFTKPAVLP